MHINLHLKREENQKDFAIHFISMLEKFLFGISLITQIDIGQVSQAWGYADEERLSPGGSSA